MYECLKYFILLFFFFIQYKLIKQTNEQVKLFAASGNTKTLTKLFSKKYYLRYEIT